MIPCAPRGTNVVDCTLWCVVSVYNNMQSTRVLAAAHGNERIAADVENMKDGRRRTTAAAALMTLPARGPHEFFDQAHAAADTRKLADWLAGCRV